MIFKHPPLILDKKQNIPVAEDKPKSEAKEAVNVNLNRETASPAYASDDIADFAFRKYYEDQDMEPVWQRMVVLDEDYKKQIEEEKAEKRRRLISMMNFKDPLGKAVGSLQRTQYGLSGVIERDQIYEVNSDNSDMDEISHCAIRRLTPIPMPVPIKDAPNIQILTPPKRGNVLQSSQAITSMSEAPNRLLNTSSACNPQLLARMEMFRASREAAEKQKTQIKVGQCIQRKRVIYKGGSITENMMNEDTSNP